MLCVLDQCEFLSKKTRKKKSTSENFPKWLSCLINSCLKSLHCHTSSICYLFLFNTPELSWTVIPSLCVLVVRPCPTLCDPMDLTLPLSVGFSRQEYWSGLPFPPAGDLLNPGIEPRSPVLQSDSLLSEPPGKPSLIPYLHSVCCSLRNFWFHKCDEGARKLLWNSQRGLYLHICTSRNRSVFRTPFSWFRVFQVE